MIKTRLLRKYVSILIVFSLLFSTQAISFAQTESDAGTQAAEKVSVDSSNSAGVAKDISAHWAEQELTDWWSSGRLQGYSDGTFKPDISITRGEFLALVNRVFGYTERATISFTDLGAGDWAYAEAEKAIAAGYIQGYSNGTLGADKPISRQEAGVMIARLMKLAESGQAAGKLSFTDEKAIAAWSHNAVALVAAQGWIKGYADGSYRPEAAITRAEAVVTINRAITSKLPIVYDKPGIYGPESDKLIVAGNIVVRASGVTLRNLDIHGNLLLDEAIGEGDAWLKHTSVAGTTEIKGGGANSIHFEDSNLANTVINKKSGTIRVVAAGTTIVAHLSILTSTVLEHSGAEGTGFKLIILDKALPAGASLHFIGSFEAIDINAKDIKVVLSAGTVKTLNVHEGASGIELQMDKEAVVRNLILDAIIKLLGQGTIDSAVIGVNGLGTTFEKQPNVISNKASSTPSSTPSASPASTAVNPTASPVSPTASPVSPTATPVSPTATPVSPTPTPASGSLTLVDNGLSKAIVLISSYEDEEAKSAADTLVEYISKSTGTVWPITTEAEWLLSPENSADKVKIYVGSAGADSDPGLDGQLNGLKLDGFVISPFGNSITIVGPTALGTEFGVYEFLERYVGVRWLMPGEAGEDVPELASLAVPRILVREEPAMISRDVVGFMGYHTREADEDISRIQLDWATKNRNNSAINFHHNLYNLFPPSKYLESNPEFFPHKNGKPNIPALNMGWQPCFSAEGIVEEAIKNIIAYFDENPDKISYSLGIIDGNAEGAGFCETAVRKNSLGVDDMSNVYYEWVNKVAEGVLEVYPDKYFGLLAYAEVFDPPTNVVLNSHVIPNITDERYSWKDPVREQEGKQIMENWLQSATQVAWYDYLWGSPYVVPRIFNHQLAENLRYANANGVVGFFAELYPNFGEGPKPWLTMKLLWNPNQDEDELVQEWYDRAVGPAAAGDLAAYYDYWEAFWNTRAFETEWYKTWFNSNPRYNFMPFNSASYLTDVTVEDMEESRRLLELVVQKAATPQQKVRAGLLLRSFEYYEASALSYPIANDRDVPSDPAEALALLEELIRREAKNPAALALKRQELIDEFESNPILVHPIRGPEEQGMIWSGESNTAYLLQWIASEPENSMIRQYLSDLVLSEGNSATGQYAQYLLEYPGKMIQLNKNDSFEEADVNSRINAKDWGFWYSIENPTEAEFAERTDTIARTGSYSIAAEGISLGSITQEIRVPEPLDFVSASAYYYTMPGTSGNGKFRITMNMFDENWQSLGSLASVEKIVSGKAGEWAPVKLIAAIPEAAKDRLKIIQLLIEERGFSGGETVYIDDVKLNGVTSGKASVVKTSAENGRIVALLSGIPEHDPIIGDFTVTQKLDDGAAIVTAPTAIVWNAANRTATLTLPAVSATDATQTIAYTVKYLATASVAAKAFTLAAASSIVMNQNASFEEFDNSSVIKAAHWSYWYNNENRTEAEAAYRTDSHAKTGTYSIAAKGISLGSMLQEIRVSAPLDSISMKGYYFAEPGSGNGKIRYTMNLFDDKWENLGYLTSPFVNTSDISGEWLPIEFSAEIPDNIKDRVKTIQFMFEQREFALGETVYIDDLSFSGKPDSLVSVIKAVAENGSIKVALSGEPTEIPVAGDFTVQQKVNGAEAVAVSPLSVTWDAINKTAVLAVPVFESAEAAQTITYTVVYRHASSVEAAAFTVVPLNNTLLNKNVSFEVESIWGAIGSDYWGYWYNNADRTEAESASRNAFARSGEISIAVEGISLGGITQDLQVDQPITDISTAIYYYLPSGMSSNGKLVVSMNLKDVNNSDWIGSLRSQEFYVSGIAGSWVRLEFTAKIPVGIQGSLRNIQFVVQQEGFAAGEKIFVDDITVQGWNDNN